MALIDKPADAVRELVKYRTLNSKRFDLGNGFHRIIHRLGRVHFQDDDVMPRSRRHVRGELKQPNFWKGR